MRVFRQRRFCRQQQEAAGHAQVRQQQQPALKLEHDDLPAPPHALDPSPTQATRKRGGRRLRRNARLQQLRGDNAPPPDKPSKRTRDEFNFGAQTESFAFIARSQGLTVDTVAVPGGRHDKQTALQMLPAFIDFLGPRLKPYAPKD